MRKLLVLLSVLVVLFATPASKSGGTASMTERLGFPKAGKACLN